MSEETARGHRQLRCRNYLARDFLAGSRYCFLIVLFELIQLFIALDVERLTQLRTIAIQRVSLEAELPAQFVALLDIFDGRLVRQVDRLGDRAADERLSRRHHADVPFDGDVPLSELAASVRAVEHRKVAVLQSRRALDGAAAADHVVGFVDLLLIEAQPAEQVEIGRLPFRLRRCPAGSSRLHPSPRD